MIIFLLLLPSKIQTRTVQTTGGITTHCLNKLSFFDFISCLSTFRKSLDESIFSSVLKICYITTVLKSDDLSNDQNYRLIFSIISHLGKLFEFIVYSKIKSCNNT